MDQGVQEMQQFTQQIKKDAAGLTRRQCLEMIATRVLARGGLCADQRTRAFLWLYWDMYHQCKRLLPLEQQKAWDDEEMQDSLARRQAKARVKRAA